MCPVTPVCASRYPMSVESQSRGPAGDHLKPGISGTENRGVESSTLSLGTSTFEMKISLSDEGTDPAVPRLDTILDTINREDGVQAVRSLAP